MFRHQDDDDDDDDQSEGGDDADAADNQLLLLTFHKEARQRSAIRIVHQNTWNRAVQGSGKKAVKLT